MVSDLVFPCVEVPFTPGGGPLQDGGRDAAEAVASVVARDWGARGDVRLDSRGAVLVRLPTNVPALPYMDHLIDANGVCSRAVLLANEQFLFDSV